MGFLQRMSKIYEIIVFTSSQKSYAKAIMSKIEKNETLIHYKLFREHCIEVDQDFYVKDLRILNRNPKNVIIVDNSPYAFAAQLENGYPIIPFYKDKTDNELEILEEYLMQIKEVEDIREENRKRFRLAEISDRNIDKYARYYKFQTKEEIKQSAENTNAVEESLELDELKNSLNEFFSSKHK